MVFAPKPRDFSQKINKKMKTAALKSALSQKVRQDEFLVLEEIKLAEAKTRLMAEIFKNLDIKGKTLIITNEHDETIMRAARNIEGVTITEARLQCLRFGQQR